MSADNRHVDVLWIQAKAIGNECVRAANVEGRYAEELLGVILPRLLENFGGNGYGRVYGIADDGCLFVFRTRRLWRGESKSQKNQVWANRQHRSAESVYELADHRIGTEPRAPLHEGLDDARICVEEVVPRHSRLPRHACGDHHDVRTR